MIPIWIAGRWSNKNPLKRASKYDGICPISAISGNLNPNDVKEIINFIKGYRNDINNFEIVLAGDLPLDKIEAKNFISPFIESGITWWLDSINDWKG